MPEHTSHNTNVRSTATIPKDFHMGKPVLVCRWRLYHQALPLLNRHMRALGSRRLGGVPLQGALLQWTKQHIEWTLEDGSYDNPEGVLMIVVDDRGQAAMSVGPYKPLDNTGARELAIRALKSRMEFEETRIAPETIWVVQRDGTLLMGAEPDERPSGAASLIEDLAKTLGMAVLRVHELASQYLEGSIEAQEVFLVSDEYGVVPARDAAGVTAAKFRAGYAKLLKKTNRK